MTVGSAVQQPKLRESFIAPPILSGTPCTHDCTQTRRECRLALCGAATELLEFLERGRHDNK